MTSASFVSDVLPDAQIASSATGVPVSVIIAQWANETGWGTSQAWQQGNNYAGVSPGGSVASYPTRAAGLAAYISTLLNPFYNAVRSAGTSAGAADALGRSPWAASHYDSGTGPGSMLLGEITANDLTQYDATTTGLKIPNIPGFTRPLLPGGWGGGILGGPGGSVGGPVGGVAGDVAGQVASTLVNALREPAIKAVGVAGAVGLFLMAGWQASRPARAKLGEEAGKAAKVAAVAA